ncbi:MAG TPA: TIR domain-containing protein [Blastocatellia bacterium]|nr:TIR domain-containing protein [Blastocatellia bacterium]
MAASSELFLSYNTRDRADVLRVQEALRARGIATFLDCQHLTVGLNWRDEVEAALTKVNSVAVFIGSEGFGRVQRGEKNLALDRQEAATHEGRKFPVIPILLPGAKADDVAGFLSQNTWIDLRAGLENATAMDAIARAIKGEEPDAQAASPEPLCPYRGLLAFTEDDAPLFYGRDTFADDLLQKARTLKLIVVVGPSGTGKSSVVQAGLLPRLRRERAPNATWEAIIFRPGNRPFHNLADELVALYETSLSKTDQMLAANKLGEALAKNELPLDIPIAEALKATKWANRLLIIADQFEELFTLTEEKDRKPFVNLLLKAAETASLTIVLTLRGDFYNQAISVSRELSDLMQQGIINIGYVKREELSRAIVEPAKTVGLQFEDGLVDRILENLEDEPGNLPLLEFALTELWEKRQGNRVTNQLYKEIGGVAGSVGKRAEDVFTSLHATHQTIALRAFTRLVRVSAAGEEGSDTRQRVTLKDFNDASVLQSFVKARLLVTSHNDATGEEIVEVAHEALIKSWERLIDVVRKDREFLLWRQELNFLRIKWLRACKQTNNDRDGLLFGSDLAKAREWLKSNEDDLNEAEKSFISKSEVAAREPKKKLIAGGISLFIIILAAWGWKKLDERPASQIGKIVTDSKSLVPIANTWSRNYWLKVLIKMERWEDALSESEHIPNAYFRAVALAAVATNLAQTGKIEQAKVIAEESLNSARNIGNDKYPLSLALAEAAKALASVGKWETARIANHESFIAAQELRHTFFRFDALAKLAEALAQTGSASEAVKIAKSIEDPYFRSVAQSSVSRSFSQIGQKPMAEEIADAAHASANTIGDPGSRATALAYIAQSFMMTGRLEDAQKAAEDAFNDAKNVSESDLRSTTLTSVAEVLAQAGQTQKAKEAADDIGELHLRSSALTNVAKSLIQIGRMDAARAIAQEARDISKNVEINFRFYILASVAQSFAQAGDAEAAKSTLDEILPLIPKLGDDRRSKAYSEIAQALAKLSNYQRAREIAALCSNSDDKLSAYAAILQEYSFAEKIPSRLVGK